LFSWDLDLRSEFELLYPLQAERFESNTGYRFQIWRLVFCSILNAAIHDFAMFRKKISNLRAALAQDFSGISQSISIAKAAEILSDHISASEHDYDLVVLVRPDVILLDTIDLENYAADRVTCNQYKDRQGDFRWVFGPRFLSHFASLPAHFKRRGIRQPHTWIPDYFDSRGLPYFMDSVQAGSGEEVLRKSRGNGIPYWKLKTYGLSEAEYSKYPK
jgi:hypothetical protein